MTRRPHGSAIVVTLFALALAAGCTANNPYDASPAPSNNGAMGAAPAPEYSYSPKVTPNNDVLKELDENCGQPFKILAPQPNSAPEPFFRGRTSDQLSELGKNLKSDLTTSGFTLERLTTDPGEAWGIYVGRDYSSCIQILTGADMQIDEVYQMGNGNRRDHISCGHPSRSVKALDWARALLTAIKKAPSKQPNDTTDFDVTIKVTGKSVTFACKI